MTKKQYFIPQTETLPLFQMTALCASGDPASPDAFTIGGGIDPDNAM